MLPIIGTIVGLYVITRMAETYRDNTGAVRALSALTLMMTVLLTAALVLSGL